MALNRRMSWCPVARLNSFGHILAQILCQPRRQCFPFVFGSAFCRERNSLGLVKCWTPHLQKQGLMAQYFWNQWRESARLMVMVLKVFLFAKETDDLLLPRKRGEGVLLRAVAGQDMENDLILPSDKQVPFWNYRVMKKFKVILIYKQSINTPDCP